MNNNSDTISKLSEALSNLINAYETLQKEKETVEQENKNLQNKNETLEANIKELTASKDELNSKLDDMNSTSEKQGNNINSMLSKIENILSVGDKKLTPQEETKPEPVSNEKPKEESIIDDDVFETTPLKDESFFKSNKEAEPVKVDDIQLEKKEDEKIDLNRMASLLNGFNK